MSAMSDTSPEMRARLDARLRAMTPRERFWRVLQLNEALRLLALAEIRRRHPDEDERSLARRLAARTLGSAVVDRLRR